jgi:lysosomal acid lipase/cholesteryl ester hydrolase
VVTDDGYILALHRIINPLSSEPKSQSKPILLQHGLLGSSADFLINTPQLSSYDNQIYNDIEINAEVGNNLGFVLSSNGWDVFLSNSRGNTYSTNHTKLKTNGNN